MTDAEKQTFTIVLIDDHYDNKTRDIESIYEYIEKKGVTPNVLTSKKGEDIHQYVDQKGFSKDMLPTKSADAFYKYLKDHDIDILLADKNLGSKTGIGIVKKIRAMNPIVDILYYSGVSIDDSDHIELGKYFSVEVIEDRLFVPTLKKIIDRNLSRWDDVVFLRGVIISHIIVLETKLNEFFIKYFDIAEHTLPHFDFILGGTAISLEGKKQVLSKIMDKYKTLKEFNAIIADITYAQCERNILAHCRLHPTIKNTFISKSDETYTKDRMTKVLRRIEDATIILIQLSEKLDSDGFKVELKS